MFWFVLCVFAYFIVGAYSARYAYVTEYRREYPTALKSWETTLGGRERSHVTGQTAEEHAHDFAHDMGKVDAAFTFGFWPMFLPVAWYRHRAERRDGRGGVVMRWLHAPIARERAAAKPEIDEDVVAQAERIVREWQPPKGGA
jgi:hypothetical protein